MSYVLAITPDIELLPDLRALGPAVLLVAEASLSRGLDRVQREPCSVVLLDTAYDERLALDLVDRLVALRQRVALLARSATTALRQTAMARGALDVLPFPCDADRIGALLRGVALGGLDLGAHAVVGRNPAFVAAFEVAARVAGTNATVLIHGESGTGKELLAQFLHRHSARAPRPFVAVNCAAIPESLLESELFGYEKGAFTGAVARHLGRFERAGGGTLFLDEVAELSVAMQAKLLRVLQERTVERIGGRESIRVDARIVTATNRDLAAEVAAGRFREDLYYRLAVIPLELPPLRARLDDLPLLAAHFIARFAHEHGTQVRELAADALGRLQGYGWPGNVRELQNVLERAVLLANGPVLSGGQIQLPQAAVVETASEIRAGLAPPAEGGTLLPLEEVERRHIWRALELTSGHLTGAARILGIHRNTLRRKLQSYGWSEGSAPVPVSLTGPTEDEGEDDDPPRILRTRRGAFRRMARDVVAGRLPGTGVRR